MQHFIITGKSHISNWLSLTQKSKHPLKCITPLVSRVSGLIYLIVSYNNGRSFLVIITSNNHDVHGRERSHWWARVDQWGNSAVKFFMGPDNLAPLNGSCILRSHLFQLPSCTLPYVSSVSGIFIKYAAEPLFLGIHFSYLFALFDLTAAFQLDQPFLIGGCITPL